MKVPNKLQKWLINKKRLIHCPHCRQIMSPKFVQDWIFHPEEPPMFSHYICAKCDKRLTGILATELTKDVIKQMGYKSIDEYEQYLEKQNG